MESNSGTLVFKNEYKKKELTVKDHNYKYDLEEASKVLIDFCRSHNVENLTIKF